MYMHNNNLKKNRNSKKNRIDRTIRSLTICSISAKSAEVAPSSDLRVKLETCRKIKRVGSRKS